MSFASGPLAAIALAAIGWLTASGFSHPPYAQLRPTGTAAVNAAVLLGASALAGAAWACYSAGTQDGSHW